MKNYIMEFTGTMFWVLVLGFSGNPLAVGIIIVALIYVGENISGAHYNPAVTLAAWFRGKIESKYVWGYWVSQFLGAFAAAFIYYIIQEKSFYPSPAEGVELWKCMLLELLFTFVICMAALAFMSKRTSQKNYAYGIAIGSAVAAGIFSVGPITGGVFNPAVYLGPMLMDSFTGGSSIQFILLYLVGPFGGGALAALVYGLINQEEAEN